jgi:hypothetical protein
MMTPYTIALFFHVVGAIGFFIAIAFEWVSLIELQRITTVDEINQWFKRKAPMQGMAGISMLIILIAGFYMTFAAWGGADWVEVAFSAMIVQGIIAGVLTTPRMRAIRKAIASESGPISPTLDRLLHHPLLWVSMLTRVGIALGIVFLMTVKPALVGSLIVLGVAILVGLAFMPFTMGSRRNQQVAA